MRLFGIILIALLLNGCVSSTSLKHFNLADVYRSTASINPDFTVLNESDSITVLHYRLNTKNLLYRRADNQQLFKASAQLSYKLYLSYSADAPLDSGDVIVQDSCQQIRAKSIYGQLKIKTDTTANFVLKIESKDGHRKTAKTTFIEIYKAHKITRSDFLLVDQKTELPLFKNHLSDGDTATLVTSLPQSTFKVRYYNRRFKIAPPPFMIYNRANFEYIPDSSYTIEFIDHRSTVVGQQEGFEFIYDEAEDQGYTFYHRAKNFPKVSTPHDMITSARYIMSKRENEKLISSTEQKLAVEKFWLQNASSPTRARDLIKHYYGRVQKVNHFFSSHLEGWQTDRGMTYIVFGPPTMIFKSGTSEVWTYGEQNNFMSMSFTFMKVSNRFSSNDYVLDRSPIFKTNWYKSVDSWRQGRVFRVN